jgi:N-acetylneuraminic acid mutarotase
MTTSGKRHRLQISKIPPILSLLCTIALLAFTNPAHAQVGTTSAKHGNRYDANGNIISNPVTPKVATTPFPPATNWEIKEPMGLPRAQPALLAGDDGGIYVFGGYDGAPLGEYDDVARYDPGTDSWTVRADMPLAVRGGASARGADGKMYVLGGAGDHNLIYDPLLDSWATGAAIPQELWESAATHGPDGRIYVFGGEADFPDAVYIYDPDLDSWAQGPNMFVGLEQHGAVLADDGLIYVIGGRDVDLDIPLASVNVYDPNTDTWMESNVPDMPSARSQFGTALGSDGKIYVIGGKTTYDNNFGPFFDDIFVYDPNTNTWSTSPDLLNTARGELAAAAVGNVIYAMGGSNGVGLATNEALTLPQPAQLSFEDAFGGPDGIVTVDLVLDTDWDVGGIEFNVRATDREEGLPPSQNVSLEGIINNFEGAGWSVFSSTDPETGVTTGLVVHTSGGYFEAGDTYNVLKLVYRVAEAPPAPLWIDIEFIDPITLSDPNATSVPLEYHSGTIRIGEPGDLIGGSDGNGDGQINILDIVKMVNYIVGKTPAPDEESFTHWQADVVPDDDLNILDLVWLINAYLDIEEPPQKVVAADRAVVSLNAVQINPTGQLMIPVTFDSDGKITAAQLSLTFDPTRMQLGEPILADHAGHLTLRHHVVEGTLNLVAYSLDGSAIPAGNEAIVLIPVQLLGGNEDGGTVHLTSILLADSHATEIRAQLGQTAIKVAQVPGAFSLESATPNPSTQAPASPTKYRRNRTLPWSSTTCWARKSSAWWTRSRLQAVTPSPGTA